MQAYFKIQFALMNRKIIDFGCPLIIAYPLFIATFILLSNTLYAKTDFANYIMLIFALSLATKRSEPKRNEFLKSVFNRKNYICLRVTENIICCLPFTLYLAYEKQFLFILILNLLLVFAALLKLGSRLHVTIPTPFGKKPFEFTIGFRNTFYIFPMAYFLTYVSITVNNFNLGIFSLLLIGITCLSYYAKVERHYLVWNFNVSPKAFLFEKIKIGFAYFTFLSVPIVLALGISFFSKIDILLVFFLFCYAYLSAIVFAKYASFPNKIDMQQGIFIALSIVYPYTMVIIIPFLYVQAIKKLKPILNDYS